MNSPRIWITYAWVDDDVGDFSYLVQRLATVEVEATYDRRALIPGRRLWQQIAEHILSGKIDGWGYLLTANSLSSEACKEELGFALLRALDAKGEQFPLIGLLHGVRIGDVPPSLRIRLCVNLADANWPELVKAGLEGRQPNVPVERQDEFEVSLHTNYGGISSASAVEVRPRFREVMYWRFAVPKGYVVQQWGHGPSGGGAISRTKTMSIDGEGAINGGSIKWFGAGDRLSPSISAYVAFSGAVPPQIYFGVAQGSDFPSEWKIIQCS
ncbi:MAG: toll/interleukin-1 receptor domain-containing protein [Chloroflexi bacterium]|nr:toll/interleukin-1 receptor domain-containing protein [Chloroflexota bacterium]